MDRVLPSEGRGCWFDPSRAHQDSRVTPTAICEDRRESRPRLQHDVPMGMISRFLDRLAAVVRALRAVLAALSSDAEGLQIGEQRVAWRDVRRVDAFKREV